MMEHFEAYLALFTVAVMFTLFLRESYPTEIIALGGAGFLLITGVLSAERALEVFSNPAPWTIAAMFILSGALVRTGTLEQLTQFALAHAKTSPKRVLGGLAVFVILASAFMNNTPVVVIMIPVVIEMAAHLKLAPSKLLIPLSYLAILGGLCTLLGTSTNLLVDGVAQAEGLAPFTLFEITPLAVILVVIGVVYMRLFAPFLLPDRASISDILGRVHKRNFLTQIVIPEGSQLIGSAPNQIERFRRDGIRVYDVIRKDVSLRRVLPTIHLEAGDQVVLRTEMGSILSLRDDANVELADKLGETETIIVEALIAPTSKLVGRSLRELRLRRRFGVYPIALHRRNQNLTDQLEEVKIEIADTVLLEGASEDIQRMAQELDLTQLERPQSRPFRRKKAPIVLAALGATVFLSALGLAPIFVLAAGAVALVFLTRTIDSEEGFEAIDGRLLCLIFSMLAVGAALQSSGAVMIIVEALAPYLKLLPPFFVIWSIYLMTSILTELVSNNAVAVVVTPIAIAVGNNLGIDPRALVVAVMVAASASFATPIGYQTNTLVYGPGGYQFTDFLKIGLPLNLLIGLAASALIPLIWAI